jgi:hypothetical protein
MTEPPRLVKASSYFSFEKAEAKQGKARMMGEIYGCTAGFLRFGMLTLFSSGAAIIG